MAVLSSSFLFFFFGGGGGGEAGGGGGRRGGGGSSLLKTELYIHILKILLPIFVCDVRHEQDWRVWQKWIYYATGRLFVLFNRLRVKQRGHTLWSPAFKQVLPLDAC